jgi:putative ABC transport system ATP-binding protein
MEIVVRKVSKSFDGGLVVALDDVSVEFGKGERVVVTGPTGCGKSTLLSLLALLDRPDSGEILIEGSPGSSIASPEAWRAANVGIVFQLHHLLPHLTALENVMLAVDSRRDGRERGKQILEQLNLQHRAHTRANKLSGGERQLAAVGRALIARPRLVIADEPTGSVDSKTGQRILAAITEWSQETGGTLVLATHDPSVAAWADREVRLLDGRVSGDDRSAARQG